MKYEEIIADAASQLGMPKTLVDKTYKAFWKAAKLYIISLPLKENLTDEEFNRLKPNVNIPSIGKFYVTLDRYHGLKKHFERYKTIKENKYKKDNNVKDI